MMQIDEDIVSSWQRDPNFERFFDCRWHPHFNNFKVSSVKLPIVAITVKIRVQEPQLTVHFSAGQQW